jgi:pantetheine-phosphate adenylyltransferase
MSKIAIYAGTFDPFTNGHLEIFKQAHEIFDMTYIVFANNGEKTRAFNIGKMMHATVTTIFNAGYTNFGLGASKELVADIAKKRDATYLIRGLRDYVDYGYEERIADINKLIYPELHTIYFRSDNIISSSMVREFFSYGKDVSPFVSSHVLEVMNQARHIDIRI